MIYYFSATGNSQWVAEMLAGELGDEAVSMTSYDCGTDTTAPKAEAVGLCFPVHGWRIPSIVRQFVTENAALLRCGYLYAVITCGDDCGETIKWLRKCLDEVGVQLSAAFSVQMPESYVGLPFMDTDTKEKEERKIADAERQIKEIAAIVRRREAAYRVHEGGCAWLKSKVIGGFFHHVLISDKRFKVEADKCIGCGRCLRVCPVDNIEIIDGLPTWQHNGDCMTCLACYHICPHHAIVFNGQTKKKGQYRRFLK